MAGFFAFIFLVLLVVLPISLIKPSLFTKLGIHTRKKASAVFGTSLLASFMAFGFTVPPVEEDITAVENVTENPNTEVEGVNSDNLPEEKIPTNTPTLTPTPEPTAEPTNTPVPTQKPTTKPSPTPTKIFIPTATPTQTVIINNPPPSTGGNWNCDCSKTCTQISSCGEAQYLLNTCGCGARDADKDGIACDSAPLNCQN